MNKKITKNTLAFFMVLIATIATVDLNAETNGAAIAIKWTETELAAIDRLGLHNLTQSPELIVNKVAGDERAAELGHHLFFDQRLSRNGQVSCASCHHPDKYFTDGLETAKGLNTLRRNAPTIVGINHSNWLFLDGRADSLWSQAMQPFEDKLEHGTTRTHIAHVIYNDNNLRKRYEELFGNMPDLSDKQRFPEHAAPTKNRAAMQAWRIMDKKDQKTVTNIFVNLAKAIAAYEMKLNPASSRFDLYALRIMQDDINESDILNKEEKAGLKLFLNKGSCVICHSGPMFSDFGFHNIATPQLDVKKYDWGRYKGVNKLLRSHFNCNSEYNDGPDKNCDELKYIVKKREHTIGLFRTPSLRNVTKTAPYMHAGQYKTLEEVIDHYEDTPKTLVGSSDLIPFPINLNDDEKKQLLAFLKSLDSPIQTDKKFLKAPE